VTEGIALLEQHQHGEIALVPEDAGYAESGIGCAPSTMAESDCYDSVMPKRLPDSDFRARRRVLTRGDFAYAPKPEATPSDPVSRSTWEGIVTLPDDVAGRTSNHHGTTLTQLENLWGAWVESIGDLQDCLSPAMLDDGDDFQSTAYTALTRFDRRSISALRSALELMTIAAWAQVCGKDAEYLAWRSGKGTLSFGQGCDGLIGATRTLQERLRADVNDTLFDQKTPSSEGGLARRIFDGLSNFHTRAQDALTGICATATVQSTCDQFLITWLGCTLKRWACVSCSFFWHVPGRQCPPQL